MFAFCYGHVELILKRVFREFIADEWTRRISAATRSADKNHLVTVGHIQWAAPDMVKNVSLHQGKLPLFEGYGIAKDVESIYEVPLLFHQEGLDEKIVEKLNIWTGAPRLEIWKKIVKTTRNPKRNTTIALVGKYIDLEDSYKSLNEALFHGGLANDASVTLKFVDSEQIEQNGADRSLRDVRSILVPGGFGSRGIEGKIEAIRYSREKRIPFLGICLGMQLAVIEFARNVCKLKGAHSTEFDAKTRVVELAKVSEPIWNKEDPMDKFFKRFAAEGASLVHTYFPPVSLQ